jgi:hypothetical protein
LILPTAIRIYLGALLVIAGFIKATEPYQNFAFVIETYALLPRWALAPTAMVMPWVELVTGAFLLMGLHLRLASRSALGLFSLFILVIGQAMVRRLPVDECGCLGEWLTVPPLAMLGLDVVSWALCWVLILKLERVKR